MFRLRCLLALLCAYQSFAHDDRAINSWGGTLLTLAGEPIKDATVELTSPQLHVSARSAKDGAFRFAPLPDGSYQLSVRRNEERVIYPQPLTLPAALPSVILRINGSGALVLEPAKENARNGGEQLSKERVSELPLNKRDFSQLLLLAAGTMTDSNGATNFTQQFAINGQRGVGAVFAMDDADISDPEMGGATFSNFNVDGVEEIQSSSGWMPTDIGRGAAGFTNIITRSGRTGFHGSVFEFVRNSAFDARNFFDRRSVANPGRIPPFRRNEFGFTNGGPIILPHLYDGRNKTFYFVQYQGFRQVLGTTQVIPVPTAAERTGINTTAFPGDTLFVPVDSRISRDLNRYPLPNDPAGPYQSHTYATSSKVRTNANQFSARLDHKLSEKGQLFARFNFDNITGPVTNPSQTAIDPSFGIYYVDHQRNAILTYLRSISPKLQTESSVSFTRTTPSFPTPNHTDAALKFNDGLYEAFNNAAGTVTDSLANLFQARQNISWTAGKHNIKVGAEVRANRDTSYFGTSVNGEYTFGGGTAYSPVDILSASGQHNIRRGDPLPDTLTGLLTASPFAYTIAVAPPYFPQGDQIGVAAVSRYNANFFFADSWKVTDRFVIDYGLRYELYSPISERAHRAAALDFVDGANGPAQQYVINPEPRYRFNLNGFGPRLRLNWRLADRLQFRVGGALTTVPPNIWQDNFLTGSTPFVIYPRITAAPGAPIPFGQPITPAQLPGVFTPDGTNIFAQDNTKAVPANTVMDIDRYERGIAALSPNGAITPLNLNTMSRDFGNSYLGTWTAGFEQQVAGLTANLAYVGTSGVKLPAVNFPNGYPGADRAFAPYTQFDANGNVAGGFGTEMLMTNRSHSTYHALQASLSGTLRGSGTGLSASYTWGKSIDDTSAVIGGFLNGASGAIVQAWPQDPSHTSADRGPSTFDTRHAFTASVTQDLHGERVFGIRRLGQKVAGGWQLLSITTLTSGSPFSIYSGVQQTGFGSNGVDRPDQVANPDLSTSRTIREDYFGQGAANADFFSIPLNVANGTGPNSGRFGTLGRNAFRGPAFYNFDFALIKDTQFGHRGTGELTDLQFRAEFFNLFNIVNFGLPSNIVRGSGFGQISRTAGTSRQIQLSLKLIF